jgi:hypothetical protein
MTTPLKKKRLELKKALKNKENAKASEGIKGTAKVVEIGKDAAKDEVDENASTETEEVQPHPQMPSEEPQMEVQIFGRMLKTILCDPAGYMVAIDFTPIKNVIRTSYNVIMNELIVVLSETTGRIGEMQIPIVSPMTGKKTGGMRQEVTGQITSFKTKIEGTDNIRKFLEVYLEESPLSEETFEGFKHYEIAKEVLSKAAQLKREEQGKKKGGGLVDAAGEPITSM